MKKNLFSTIFIFSMASFMLISFTGISQDVAAVNPKLTKVLADTLGVRMIKNTLAPGDMLAMHTHPAQIIYVLEGGQITVNFKDGKTSNGTENRGCNKTTARSTSYNDEYREKYSDFFQCRNQSKTYVKHSFS